MKTIHTYISEKFQVGKDNIRTYAYEPKDRNELIECIKEKVEKEGLGTKEKPLNLNDIDTSKITDMSRLFDAEDGDLVKLSKNGYFDISDWDVANVTDMYCMFYYSSFDGNISDWDVSNVKNMKNMFAHSLFNSNISDWNVSRVRDMSYMFYWSKFTGKNGSISNWNVSNVEIMTCMFSHTKFSSNIDKWNIKSLKHKDLVVMDCPLEDNPPKWYKF